ncbi:MAG: sel1 repeat family protein [Sulfuricella sp.]|nr:sel1 repeat family protein [Sulfuricella sp.]
MLRLLSAALNTFTLLAGKARAVQAFDEGFAYYDQQQYVKAYPLMLESAEAGFPRAMSILGSMYVMGYGVKEDGKQAAEWLKKAVESGDRDAASVLGMVYVTGKGGAPRRINEGISLLENAAAGGDEKASQMLMAIRNREGMFRNLRYHSSRI